MKQNSMKQKHTINILLAIGFTFIVGMVFAIGSSFQTKPTPPKTYTVSLSVEQWGMRITDLQNAARMVRTSREIGPEIASCQDSLIVFIQEIQKQVNEQINAEAKKDSTNVKPKK